MSKNTTVFETKFDTILVDHKFNIREDYGDLDETMADIGSNGINLNLIVTPHEDNAIVTEYISALRSALSIYQEKYKMLTHISRFTLTSNWNIQYYKAGQGYKNWHCERGSNNKRLLVWMTYLNDVPGGGTEFLYQKITSPAKKGLTMFWPTDWTHTHKGQISEDHEKYIATGWLDFVDD